MRRSALAVAVIGVVLATAGCTAATVAEEAPTSSAVPSSALPTPVPATTAVPFDSSRIEQVASQELDVAGITYEATLYSNAAYQCGRSGAFPFVVLQQSRFENEERPLWAMLRGGGVGYYDETGRYHGEEGYNDAEDAGTLLAMVVGYVGSDGQKDTFMGDRIRSGDRIALGSLCDHDLMMGLGQAYPNNPEGGTVDGLLANLAMVEYLAADASETRVIGQSAGSFGAWALGHELWARGLPIDGIVMDSGYLGDRALELFDLGVASEYGLNPEEEAPKLGAYFTDPTLYAENAVRNGFDVPIFDADDNGDPVCGGTYDTIAAAIDAGYDNNCDYLNGGLAEAIDASGDPATQQVHIYDGNEHIITDDAATAVQDDLRDWFDTIAG
jgi:hypothetical protein